jgi:hypothetical protein
VHPAVLNFVTYAGSTNPALINADFSVLNQPNPYVHFSLDNPMASKFCRGRLFEGALENEARNIVFRRNHQWEHWNGNEEGEEEEQEQ